MNTIRMHVLVLLAATTACMGMPGPHTIKPLKALNETMMGNIIHEFGRDVSLELQKPGNVVISPLSISTLLSLLLMGSAGRSNQDLRRVLRFPNTLAEDNIHASCERLMDAIAANSQDITLNIANALFLQKGVHVIYDFTQKARKHYNSVVSTLNFHESVAATGTINEWVKESTSGMIPELFKQPLPSQTTFVAVNTVFFYGKWITPFSPEMTTEQEFDTGVEKIKVPMMSGTIETNYIHIPELNAHMAAFPYQGSRQTMYIILPRGTVTNDLKKLERQLSFERLNSLINNMTSIDMRVWLPRMRLSFKTSLLETLSKLGAGSIFSPATADFSRMTSLPVWVDDVLHETVMEVTEEGTKAAALTLALFTRSGTSRTFVVNRPAIFFIRDEESGVPLFWGRLVRPDPLRE